MTHLACRIIMATMGRDKYWWWSNQETRAWYFIIHIQLTYQWLPMTTNDYQWLPMTIKNTIEKTIEKTIKKTIEKTIRWLPMTTILTIMRSGFSSTFSFFYWKMFCLWRKTHFNKSKSKKWTASYKCVRAVRQSFEERPIELPNQSINPIKIMGWLPNGLTTKMTMCYFCLIWGKIRYKWNPLGRNLPGMYIIQQTTLAVMWVINLPNTSCKFKNQINTNIITC